MAESAGPPSSTVAAPHGRRRLLRASLVALLVLIASISLVQGLRNALAPAGSIDNMWGPSRALLHHIDPYVAFLTHHRPGARPYFILTQVPNYPASALIFLWPYATLPWDLAKVLWAGLALVFTALIVLWLRQDFLAERPPMAAVALAAVLVAGTPWRVCVGNGQHAIFTLAFFALALRRFPRSVPASGVLLAVSWFKYSIGLPLSLFLARSRAGFAAIGIASIIHAGLTVFASAWTHRPLIDVVLGPIRVTQAAMTRGYSYVDLFGITSDLFGTSGQTIAAIGTLAILGTTYLVTLRDRDDLSRLSTLAIASMTFGTHRLYDFVVLAIPLAYAIRERARTLRAALYVVIVILTFFVDRLIQSAVSRQLVAQGGAIQQGFMWLTILTYYGVLLADWFRVGWQRRRAA